MAKSKLKLTPEQFMDCFRRGVADIDDAYWFPALQCVYAEIKKRKDGGQNHLIALAEYLRLVFNGAWQNNAKRILADAYILEQRYEDAWAVILEHGHDYYAREFYKYRRLIPGLKVPLRYIETRPPGYCDHWNDLELVELREAFEGLLSSYQNKVGGNIFEYYALMQDDIKALLLFEAKPFLHINPSSNAALPSLVSKQRVVIDCCARILEGQLNSLECKLLEGFDSKEAWLKAVNSSIIELTQNWRINGFGNLNESLFQIQVVNKARDGRIKFLHAEAENLLRSRFEIPLIGEGSISESTLVYRLRRAFPDLKVVTQATPKWLGRYRFDAYFPDFNIAVEYQGLQHFTSVHRFGGLNGLRSTQDRDDKKRALCLENGCILIEVLPGYNLIDLLEAIKSHTKSNYVVDSINCAKVPAKTLALVLNKKMNKKAQVGKSLVDASTDKKMERCGSISGATKEIIGTSEVYQCLKFGDEAMLRNLVDNGAKLKQLNKKCIHSLLFIAAEAGNIATIKALLGLNFDVNARDCHMQSTALSQLCHGKIAPNLTGVRALLESRADVTLCGRGLDISGSNGSAPPIVAAGVKCNIELAKLLLEFGAEINLLHEKSGNSAFLGSCMFRPNSGIQDKSRVEFMEWIISVGSNVCQENLAGKNAFDVFLGHRIDEVVNSRVIDLLMGLHVPLRGYALDKVRKEYLISRALRLGALLKYSEHSASIVRDRVC